MRQGFTTGSCAAAAAKAAAYMLLADIDNLENIEDKEDSGADERYISIQTPAGICYRAKLEEIRRGEDRVSCGIRKDGGDDPDVTTGLLICAEVAYCRTDGEPRIRIDGGKGVGRVTVPGLDQPVGNAAINRVPREMIRREVQEVCDTFGYRGGLSVEIYVPEGEALAAKTFNPRLGIQGGISILGTTGIVEPMSTQALLDTIAVELRVKRAAGACVAFVSPGNYGREFMQKTYGYDLERSVKCSNFVGQTVDMAADMGFEGLLLTGHIGKLVKLAGGIMNTHSREADCRMELLAAAAAREGAEGSVLRRILDCVTTEQAVRILEEEGCREAVMNRILERALYHLRHRAGERLQIECILYANEFGVLAQSGGAAGWLAAYGDR